MRYFLILLLLGGCALIPRDVIRGSPLDVLVRPVMNAREHIKEGRCAEAEDIFKDVAHRDPKWGIILNEELDACYKKDQKGPTVLTNSAPSPTSEFLR